jgi:hypothetical protein
MAGKSAYLSNALLTLIFNGAATAGLFQDDTTAPIATLYVSLHTLDPGPNGDQTTNEVAYTSYARVGVARTTGGWTVTGNSCSPASPILWPTVTGGAGPEAAFFAVGTEPNGAGELLYSGPIAPLITCSFGVEPELLTATTITEQ